LHTLATSTYKTGQHNTCKFIYILCIHSAWFMMIYKLATVTIIHLLLHFKDQRDIHLNTTYQFFSITLTKISDPFFIPSFVMSYDIFLLFLGDALT